MKKALLFIAVLAASTLSGLAQDSQKILDDLSKKAKGYTSVYAEYESQLIDLKAGIDLTQEGSIKVQGEKYNIDLPDYTIISDGESLYTYEKETNTCFIDYIEDVADGSFSPSQMFTIWEHDFKHELKGEAKVGKSVAYLINLYPNDPTDKPYHTIQLFVDKAKMEVVKIVVKGREGSDMIYNVKTFSPNATMKSSDFTFPEADYPGVDVIDQRI